MQSRGPKEVRLSSERAKDIWQKLPNYISPNVLRNNTSLGSTAKILQHAVGTYSSQIIDIFSFL